MDNDGVGDVSGPEATELKAASAATYAATADYFDASALSFWDRYGRRTVARFGLRLGDRVLDACCGTGASALPAAHEVGPDGHVLGVDISEPALALARAKARNQGLSNVEFRAADIERTGLPSRSFDAVVCVFGIFFLPDIAAGIAELWRLVRPGGWLAITIWGPRLFEPAVGEFWAAVEGERPDLVGGFHPWTRVTDPAELAGLFVRAGAAEPVVAAEPGVLPLTSPDDWWTIVLGTGYRATVDQLDAEAAERVRAANVARIETRGVREIQTNVVYALAHKPH
jgi:SAM-dependent methyltransferase